MKRKFFLLDIFIMLDKQLEWLLPKQALLQGRFNLTFWICDYKLPLEFTYFINFLRKAAKAVKITYKNIKQPIFTIREAFEKEPERVSSEMIEFFGQKPAPAIIGDVEGDKLKKQL